MPMLTDIPEAFRQFFFVNAGGPARKVVSSEVVDKKWRLVTLDCSHRILLPKHHKATKVSCGFCGGFEPGSPLDDPVSSQTSEPKAADNLRIFVVGEGSGEKGTTATHKPPPGWDEKRVIKLVDHGEVPKVGGEPASIDKPLNDRPSRSPMSDIPEEYRQFHFANAGGPSRKVVDSEVVDKKWRLVTLDCSHRIVLPKYQKASSVRCGFCGGFEPGT